MVNNIKNIVLEATDKVKNVGLEKLLIILSVLLSVFVSAVSASTDEPTNEPMPSLFTSVLPVYPIPEHLVYLPVVLNNFSNTVPTPTPAPTQTPYVRGQVIDKDGYGVSVPRICLQGGPIAPFISNCQFNVMLFKQSTTSIGTQYVGVNFSLGNNILIGVTPEAPFEGTQQGNYYFWDRWNTGVRRVSYVVASPTPTQTPTPTNTFTPTPTPTQTPTPTNTFTPTPTPTQTPTPTNTFTPTPTPTNTFTPTPTQTPTPTNTFTPTPTQTPTPTSTFTPTPTSTPLAPGLDGGNYIHPEDNNVQELYWLFFGEFVKYLFGVFIAFSVVYSVFRVISWKHEYPIRIVENDKAEGL